MGIFFCLIGWSDEGKKSDALMSLTPVFQKERDAGKRARRKRAALLKNDLVAEAQFSRPTSGGGRASALQKIG